LLTADGPSQAASLELAKSELARSRVGEIVFVPSLDDLAFMSAVGFVTRMHSALIAKDPRELAAICECMGWPSCAEGLPSSDMAMEPVVTLEAILLGWSPADLSLEAPVGFDSVVEFLRRVEDSLFRSLYVRVWRGDADILAKLQFAVELGGRTEIANILLGSACEASDLAADGRPIARPNFASKLAEVHRLAASFDREQFDATVADFRAAYEKERVPKGSSNSNKLPPTNLQALQENLLIIKYCDFMWAHARDAASMKTDLAQYLQLLNQLTRMRLPQKW